MKNTVMEIVFGRRLTDEEFDKITEWLDNNITDDYCLTSIVRDTVN